MEAIVMKNQCPKCKKHYDDPCEAFCKDCRMHIEKFCPTLRPTDHAEESRRRQGAVLAEHVGPPSCIKCAKYETVMASTVMTVNILLPYLETVEHDLCICLLEEIEEARA